MTQTKPLNLSNIPDDQLYHLPSIDSVKITFPVHLAIINDTDLNKSRFSTKIKPITKIFHDLNSEGGVIATTKVSLSTRNKEPVISIALSAKLLGTHYLKGISILTLQTLLDRINNLPQRPIYITRETLLKSTVNNIDIKMDRLQDNGMVNKDLNHLSKAFKQNKKDFYESLQITDQDKKVLSQSIDNQILSINNIYRDTHLTLVGQGNASLELCIYNKTQEILNNTQTALYFKHYNIRTPYYLTRFELRAREAKQLTLLRTMLSKYSETNTKPKTFGQYLECISKLNSTIFIEIMEQHLFTIPLSPIESKVNEETLEYFTKEEVLSFPESIEALSNPKGKSTYKSLIHAIHVFYLNDSVPVKLRTPEDISKLIVSMLSIHKDYVKTSKQLSLSLINKLFEFSNQEPDTSLSNISLDDHLEHKTLEEALPHLEKQYAITSLEDVKNALVDKGLFDIVKDISQSHQEKSKQGSELDVSVFYDAKPALVISSNPKTTYNNYPNTLSRGKQLLERRSNQQPMNFDKYRSKPKQVKAHSTFIEDTDKSSNLTGSSTKQNRNFLLDQYNKRARMKV